MLLGPWEVNLFSRKLIDEAKFSSHFKNSMLACLTASLVTGCAVAGNSLAEVSDADALVTGSVVQKNNPAGIEDSDAELIKTTVANASSVSSNSPVAWSNPETGTYGTIVSMEDFRGKHGQKCRGFKTKVSSFSGIGFYNGETCSTDKDRWVLSWFKAAR